MPPWILLYLEFDASEHGESREQIFSFALWRWWTVVCACVCVCVCVHCLPGCPGSYPPRQKEGMCVCGLYPHTVGQRWPVRRWQAIARALSGAHACTHILSCVLATRPNSSPNANL